MAIWTKTICIPSASMARRLGGESVQDGDSIGIAAAVINGRPLVFMADFDEYECSLTNGIEAVVDFVVKHWVKPNNFSVSDVRWIQHDTLGLFDEAVPHFDPRSGRCMSVLWRPVVGETQSRTLESFVDAYGEEVLTLYEAFYELKY